MGRVYFECDRCGELFTLQTPSTEFYSHQHLAFSTITLFQGDNWEVHIDFIPGKKEQTSLCLACKEEILERALHNLRNVRRDAVPREEVD